MNQEENELVEEEMEEVDEQEEILIQKEVMATLTPAESLRLELLNVSKDILLGKAAMRWETHKSYEDVSIDDIILQAQKMFAFVRGDE